MRAHQAEFRVRTMARVLGVSPSGFYAWLRRQPSRRAREDRLLSEAVREAHAASRGVYGAPRVRAELRASGFSVSRKRVARLMREQRLTGVTRRRKFRTTIRNAERRPAPDLVNREFSASAPNQLWVSDITEVPTATRPLYLAATVDAFSRRVVGWAMGLRQQTDLVLGALEMALDQRRAAGVIHHSDQGCQYTSFAFGARCRRAGVRPSMGSVGDCFDNAMAESFFATLECELLARTPLATPEQARREIFTFIEGWYNPRRRHSALGYRSPLDYEREFEAGR